MSRLLLESVLENLSDPYALLYPTFHPIYHRDKKKLPCYFNAGENSPVAVSPDPVSTDVLVAAADL